MEPATLPYVRRNAEATLLRLAETSPIVAITGPRQSGKTTLAKSAFPGHRYANLEDPETRLLAAGDPRSFLRGLGDAAIIDEAQRLPELFSHLQVHVDARPKPGALVLAGSSKFALDARISQSLAGRVAYLYLLPFSIDELAAADLAGHDLEHTLYAGAYPPVRVRGAEPAQWYADYLTTYVERDVRQLVQVADLDAFQRFLRLLAGWIGQTLNLTRIGADCGISANTAKAWLGVLRASFVVHVLPPHHRNFRKRLVKAPKLHFLDTGLAARLLGVTDAGQLSAHAMRGPLFESWVVSELLKGRLHRGQPDNLFFWRSQGGDEIDVVVDQGDGLVPVECKSGRTLASDWFDALDRWAALAGTTARAPHLVHGGDDSLEHRGVRVLSWRHVAELARAL